MLRRLLVLGLSPLSLFFGLLLLGAALNRRRPRASRILGAAALVLLWGASMPLVSSSLVRRLEHSAGPALAAVDAPAADVIVVLGGATASKLPPRPAVELTEASDRVLHAARLFAAGKAPVVLASGGRMPGFEPNEPEAVEMAQLLVEMGVPRRAILLEAGSVDTRGNARKSAPILARLGARSILLVTSAAHMQRAAATFEKALGPGIRVFRSPTDFLAVEARGEGLVGLLPDAGALAGTTRAFREIAARALYRLRGDT